jgi:mRNA interferase RelE/StbE
VTQYQIWLMPQASDDLVALDRPVAQRIVRKLKWLSQNFDALAPEALMGELKGLRKLRVGDYRVIYTVNPAQHALTVHLIGHRRDIYTR